MLEYKNHKLRYEISFGIRILIFIIFPLVYSGCLADELPPDLSNCTRIEYSYNIGTLDYFLKAAELHSILNSNELKYIQSLDSFIITDEEVIKNFAHNVSLVKYDGRVSNFVVSSDPYAKVDCYNNNELITSIYLHGDFLTIENRYRFLYPTGGLSFSDIIFPEVMRTFKLRYDCARNILFLYVECYISTDKYPDPSQWCDTIVNKLRQPIVINNETGIKRQMYSDQWIYEHFICPSTYNDIAEEKQNNEQSETAVSENSMALHISNYAMNPNCKPDSPGDMVLLFETKAGWNQNGGPELFTFDNHDPKGGCVLLNDGTVKFIRTEEELTALRWE